MNLTLSYVKDRLLAAGSLLQQVMVENLNGQLDNTGRNVHDAQNQLALALATVVQIEHDGAITNADAPTKYQTWNMPPGALVEALTYESIRTHPIGTQRANAYTKAERNVIADAIAVIERVNPSHFDIEG